MKLYMVIEHLRAGQTGAVYERFRRCGRMLPDGLHYVSSWLSADGQRCFQLMQTADRRLFEQWTPHWSDLVEFEVVELGPKPAGDEPQTEALRAV